MLYIDIPTKISGIYRINFPNNKYYIGRAVNIKRRIHEHYAKQDNTVCQAALKKYYMSYKDIDIEILEEIPDCDFDLLVKKEEYWIKYYNTCDKEKGYNKTDKGCGSNFGTKNTASKISEEELFCIISLLKEGKTNIEIGKKYNLHPDTIGKINQGKTYFNPSLDYPIRISPMIKRGLEKETSLAETQYNLIIDLLKNSSLAVNDIAKKVGCNRTTISKINQGKHFYCEQINEIFPIRKSNRRFKKLTEAEILEIINDLKNTDFSMIKLALKYNCSRDTIGDINSGKSHKQEDIEYPIRKKGYYPNRTL